MTGKGGFCAKRLLAKHRQAIASAKVLFMA
jgi:hypothetical protein